MDRTVRPRATIGGVPLHAMLVPFPIVCFTGALLTDLAYYHTATIQWANFSAWQLAFGTFFTGFAALFGLIDFFGGKGARPAIGWVHMAGNLAIFVIALFNNFVHARDGWISVVPTGLMLSALTVLLLIVTGYLGHRMAYLHVSRGERT